MWLEHGREPAVLDFCRAPCQVVKSLSEAVKGDAHAEMPCTTTASKECRPAAARGQTPRAAT